MNKRIDFKRFLGEVAAVCIIASIPIFLHFINGDYDTPEEKTNSDKV